jgi:hypothetical protein
MVKRLFIGVLAAAFGIGICDDNAIFSLRDAAMPRLSRSGSDFVWNSFRGLKGVTVRDNNED